MSEAFGRFAADPGQRRELFDQLGDSRPVRVSLIIVRSLSHCHLLAALFFECQPTDAGPPLFDPPPFGPPKPNFDIISDRPGSWS
jgi:hypothetical protein